MTTSSGKCISICDRPPDSPDSTSHKEPEPTAQSIIDASLSPVPYTFRVPAPTPHKGGCGVAQNAKAPPFYLQLDHTLAVLWCLFNKKANKSGGHECADCELGVGQLQWALYFLKGIKHPNGGDRAEDVCIAIQVVQDALLELYADMSSVVMQSPAALSTTMSSSGAPQPSCTRCEAFRHGYTGNMSWMPEPPVASCDKCTSVTLGAHKGGGRPRKTSRIEEDTDESTTTNKNYSNIPICDLECPKSVGLELEINELKKMAVELSKKNPETDAKSEVSMLEEWRKDQINRVKNELRRLKSLEKTMGVDSNIMECTTLAIELDSSFNPGCNSTFATAKTTDKKENDQS